MKNLLIYFVVLVGLVLLARAWDAPGNFTVSSEAQLPQPAPYNLTVSLVNSNRIILNWKTIDNNQTGFKFERSLTGTNAWVEFWNAPASPSFTNLIVTIFNAPNYFYRMRSYWFSPYSSNVGIITPSTPAIVILRWTYDSGGQSNFRLERGSFAAVMKEIAQTDKRITTYYDTNVTIGIQYYYRVRAYGVSAYSEVAVYLPTPIVTMLSICSDSVVIGWTFPNDWTNHIDYIEIERDDGILETNGSSYTLNCPYVP